MSDYAGTSLTLPGANQLLPAGTKHFEPRTARSNKVQAVSLALINSTSPIGPANAANPLGTGISQGSINHRSD